MKKYFVVLLAATLVTAGCKKDKETQRQAAAALMESANDQAAIEGEFNTIYETADDVMREDNSFKSRPERLSECADIIKDTVNKILTIDFGDTNCLCKDGLYRRGRIVIHHEGKYRTEGAVLTITLEDYYVNNNHVQGTKTITNLGNRSGNFKYSFSVTGASIEFTDGSVRSWSKTATIERVAGEGTLTPWDDEFIVTGSSSGTNRKGIDFTATTTTPLKKKITLGCARNFVSGVVTITNSNGNTLVLDYDPYNNEACDKVATVSINGGDAKFITLR